MRKILEELKKKCKSDHGRMYKRAFKKVSIYFTWGFLRLGVTANQVTALSALVAISASYFFLQPEPLNWIIGWGVLQLFNLLDTCDGEIAKCTKPTKFGSMFDKCTHVIAESLTLFAAGIGLYKASGGSVIILFGFSASFSMALFHIIHMSRKIINPSFVSKRWTGTFPLSGVFSTTNAVITSIFLMAVLDMFTAFGFRSIFLMACGMSFPILVIKKMYKLKRDSDLDLKDIRKTRKIN
jgi:phosphatidylglycerophosphate synthase